MFYKRIVVRLVILFLFVTQGYLIRYQVEESLKSRNHPILFREVRLYPGTYTYLTQCPKEDTTKWSVFRETGDDGDGPGASP